MRSYFSFLLLPLVLLLPYQPLYRQPDEALLFQRLKYLQVVRMLETIRKEAELEGAALEEPDEVKLLFLEKLELLRAFLALKGIRLECAMGSEGDVRGCEVIPVPCEKVVWVFGSPGHWKVKVGGLFLGPTESTFVYLEFGEVCDYWVS